MPREIITLQVGQCGNQSNSSSSSPSPYINFKKKDAFHYFLNIRLHIFKNDCSNISRSFQILFNSKILIIFLLFSLFYMSK